MIIAVPLEQAIEETRVAATPETVKKYTAWNFDVRIEKEAGKRSGFTDKEYELAGAKIIDTQQELYKHTDIILKINAPLPEEIQYLTSGQTIIANFQALTHPAHIKELADKGLICMALDMLPRISRAQNMDVLSSQSNLSGYAAVIEAASRLNKAIPLMMTAAGTVPPAKVLILGAGVAGLQAIATAKRLGAQVYAFDVRPQVKEQVESLGAKFIEVSQENFETSDGYAMETSLAYQKQQHAAIAAHLATTDIVITTALIPGKQAPILITEDMLKRMPDGAVIIDMAAASGGNVEGSINGQSIKINDIEIIGNSNPARLIPATASKLFANNIYNFLASQYQTDSKRIVFNFEDELIGKVCVAKGGKLLM